MSVTVVTREAVNSLQTAIRLYTAPPNPRSPPQPLRLRLRFAPLSSHHAVAVRRRHSLTTRASLFPSCCCYALLSPFANGASIRRTIGRPQLHQRLIELVVDVDLVLV